jgi:hypothetical protein
MLSTSCWSLDYIGKGLVHFQHYPLSFLRIVHVVEDSAMRVKNGAIVPNYVANS